MILLKYFVVGGYEYEVFIIIGGWRNFGIFVNVFMIFYGIEVVSDVISLIDGGLMDRELFV